MRLYNSKIVRTLCVAKKHQQVLLRVLPILKLHSLLKFLHFDLFRLQNTPMAHLISVLGYRLLSWQRWNQYLNPHS